MNDAINKLHLSLIEDLEPFNESKQRKIRDTVDSLIELEIKRVKNLQLLDARAYQLRKGDFIFDPNTKKIHKISFVAKRDDCQFDVPEGNTEILAMYGEGEDLDYFKPDDEICILVDIGELVHINRRTLEDIEEDY